MSEKTLTDFQAGEIVGLLRAVEAILAQPDFDARSALVKRIRDYLAALDQEG